MIVTTTSTVEGRPIAEYKGIVSGTAIHGVHVGKDFKALAATSSAAAPAPTRTRSTRARARRWPRCRRPPRTSAPTAIVGVALDIEGVGSNGSMLLVTVSGTAVVVAPG